MERVLVLKVGVVDVDVCVSRLLKYELSWAADKRVWVIRTTV